MKITEALRKRFNRENFPPIYIALERGWDPSIEELWEIYKAGAGEYIEGLEKITDPKEMWQRMEGNAAFCLAQAKEFLEQQMDTNEAKGNERLPKQSGLGLGTLRFIGNRATEIELEALIRSDGASTDTEAASIAQIKLLAKIVAFQEELVGKMNSLIILIGSGR